MLGSICGRKTPGAVCIEQGALSQGEQGWRYLLLVSKRNRSPENICRECRRAMSNFVTSFRSTPSPQLR